MELTHSQVRSIHEEAKEAEKNLKDLEEKFEVVDIDAYTGIQGQDDKLVGEQPEVAEPVEPAQSVWSQEDVSAMMSFPTNNSVAYESSTDNGISMPGVHALGAIDTSHGHFTQEIMFEGTRIGYTMLGFVSSDKEKDSLRRRAGANVISKYIGFELMSSANFRFEICILNGRLSLSPLK